MAVYISVIEYCHTILFLVRSEFSSKILKIFYLEVILKNDIATFKNLDLFFDIKEKVDEYLFHS